MREAPRIRLDAVWVDALGGACAAAVVLVATAAGVAPLAVADPRPLDAGAVLLAVVLAAAVAERRRRPLAVLVVLNAVPVVWYLAPYAGRVVTLAPLIGCYTLASLRGWRWGLAGTVVTALVQILAIRLVLGDTATVGVVPDTVLSAATAGSAGTAVGYYRALLAATRAQLARETRSREERARRHALEERLRIARELHDVLGHTMATISVQAGVGLHVVDQRPGHAREALTTIKRICDEGLTDVKAILGALRSDAEPEDQAPGGRLDRLPDLVLTAEAAGLRVELEVAGDPRPVPAAVDLAAYRILQEALTNVVRHAGATTVWILLAHEPEQLRVRVCDDGTAPSSADEGRGGHGIDGMRERAHALSGRFTARPHPDGGFEVCAVLPVAGPGMMSAP